MHTAQLDPTPPKRRNVRVSLPGLLWPENCSGGGCAISLFLQRELFVRPPISSVHSPLRFFTLLLRIWAGIPLERQRLYPLQVLQ